MSGCPQETLCGVVAVMFSVMTLALSCGCRSAGEPGLSSSGAGCETWHGAITRGPTDKKRVALIFTGHQFADGADTILLELARHDAHASFFLTGAFLANPELTPVIRQLQSGGHYLGPHSDQHLLYCEWDEQRTARVTRDEFESDLLENVAKLPPAAEPSSKTGRFFVPPYEHYNSDIAAWSASLGWTLINFTPGTRSNADYTGEADANFVSSGVIFDSILAREREDAHGLNGFLLLLHLGSGPGRQDKFHDRFGALLDVLAGKGYEFVRVDELLVRSACIREPASSRDAGVPAP